MVEKNGIITFEACEVEQSQNESPVSSRTVAEEGGLVGSTKEWMCTDVIHWQTEHDKTSVKVQNEYVNKAALNDNSDRETTRSVANKKRV
jgi:hypothetical protein